MSVDRDLLASQLLDAALVGMRLPRPCPSEFGDNGRYQLEEVIGMGADSFVYRAIDRRLSAEGFPARVAIKIHDSGASALGEAISARRVHHEHVVQILDSGETDDGESFLVSELMGGGDLTSVEAPCDARLAAGLIARVASGVQAMHRAGLVHGDLKPSNILLTDAGVPKVADFDLTSGVDGDRRGGNYAFIAPESLDALAPCTPPNDIFALGGILYYLLTGRLPNGGSHHEIVSNLRSGRRPASPGISRDLDKICLRALSHDPSERHDSAGAFARDLDRWLAREPIPWIPTPWHRKVHLWCRRHPARAALVGAGFVIVLTLLIGSIVYREHVIDIRALAAERAERRAEQMNLQTRGQVLDAIRMVSGASTVTPRNPRSVVIPAMVWLEHLASIDVLQGDGQPHILEMRIRRYSDLLARLTADGRASQIDARLTAYVLAYSRLLRGDDLEAGRVIDGHLRAWLPELDPADPVRVTIEAMAVVAGLALDDSLLPSERILRLERELALVSALSDTQDAIDLLRLRISQTDQGRRD